MIKIDEISIGNLEKTQKILNIILENVELQGGADTLYGNKIAIEIFNRAGISYNEAKTILDIIYFEKGFVQVMNYELVEKSIKEKIIDDSSSGLLEEYDIKKREEEEAFNKPLITPEIFNQYLFLLIKDINKLKDFKEKTDKKIENSLVLTAETKKENKKNKFPYKLPAGTTWSNIVITFLDDENISISAVKKIHKTDYVNMGFVDRRHNVPCPDKSWFLLKLLAKLYGELMPEDRERDDKYKKQKQLLSESLKYYFSIDSDPFYGYKEYIPEIKKSKSYKIKIILVYPEKKKAKEVNSYLYPIGIENETPKEEFDREIKESFDKETSQK